MKTPWIIAAAVTVGLAKPALAQEKVKLVNVVELSGAGATAGTNWKNGIEPRRRRHQRQGRDSRPADRDRVHYDTADQSRGTRAPPCSAPSTTGTYRGASARSISGPIGASHADRGQRAEIAADRRRRGRSGLTRPRATQYIFRTSLSQDGCRCRRSRSICKRHGQGRASVAVVWVNNDFGKGGRDAIIPGAGEASASRSRPTSRPRQGQADFAADAIKIKNANADAVFVYLNEEESARFLRAAKQQGITKPMVGETTLLGAKVIELAGDAANGVRGHVGLVDRRADPGLPGIRQEVPGEVQVYASDHNGAEGLHRAVYMVKCGDREGRSKFDKKGDRRHAARRDDQALPTMPGILIETTIEDDNGDLDRESFLAEVQNGKQVITATLPKIKP